MSPLTAMIVALLISLAIAIAVMAVVAIPARRQGREILTAKGERVVVKVRATTDTATSKASGAVASASGKRSDSASSKRKAS